MSKESAMNLISSTPTPAAAVVSIPEGVVAPVALEQPLESTRFAALAKKEAQVVKDREANKAERAKVDQIVKMAQEFEDMRKADPIAALKKLGFNETEIFNFMAAENKPEPTADDKARLIAQEELKKYQDQQLTQQQKAQAEKDTAIIQQYKKNITDTLKTNADKMKANAHFGPVAEEMAYMMAEEAVKGGQDAPSPQEALELVEEYYKWQYEDMKKFYEPIAPVVEPEESVQPTRTRVVTPPIQQPAPAPKTLTNKVTTTLASTVKKPETRSEKRERLMRQLSGN